MPRTIGDIDKSTTPPAATAVQQETVNGVVMTNGINGTTTPVTAAHDDSGEEAAMDEDRDLDMVVVCSGDLTDEVLLHSPQIKS